uniref:Exportin-1 n=1 Tax=Parastrongyloides trichosuri TaxID=131310 RepID=A0A0N4ZS17_PARTI
MSITKEVLLNAESVLKSGEKFSVEALDAVVRAMSIGTGEVSKLAMNIMTDLKAHPDSWNKVDIILSKSEVPESKFFALQILEDLITTRWKSLPREQCDGIKSFIVGLVLTVCNEVNTLDTNHAAKAYLKKLNWVLVNIVKQEWPTHWPTFITEIVASSRSSESLCANNLYILRLLSEELFEFGNDVTAKKQSHMKNQFCNEFEAVFDLCYEILRDSKSVSLISSTLETLNRFLQWIPIGYIFETDIILFLVEKFLPHPCFRTTTINCLAEIAGVNISSTPQHEEKIKYMMINIIKIIMTQISLDIDFTSCYTNGKDEDQKFLSNFAKFLTTFLRQHQKILVILKENENENTLPLKEAHMIALQYLLKISTIDDTEIFKVCLDFWAELVTELFRESPFSKSDSQVRLYALDIKNSPNRAYYSEVISNLRALMISKMAKPEEVIVVVNENNEAVRESVKDTDAIILYRTMKETLVYLTHLDPNDTEKQMSDKLQKQVDGSEWSWNNLSRLCWAIGSISGAMHEDDERRFLVTVIRDLLALCEQKRGKDNKAVIASNIMYVVGQYPRFLRAFWRFLKTVINKLFEFMHESHDGVQDMACDTFIKIVMKTKKHFVIVQNGESGPFIEEIINNLEKIIEDLSKPQVHVFYEALGIIVGSVSDPETQRIWLMDMFKVPNRMWQDIIASVEKSPETFIEQKVLDSIINVLKTYVSSCKSIGHPFVSILNERFLDMMHMYTLSSKYLDQGIKEVGESVCNQTIFKLLRSLRREILLLLSAWISHSKDKQIVLNNYMKLIIENILEDYNTCNYILREPKVLSLMSIVAVHLEKDMNPFAVLTFDKLFLSTLEMIKDDMVAFPENRVNFYKLLHALFSTCDEAIFEFPVEQMETIIQAIAWGAQHQLRDVAETAIDLISNILRNVDYLPLPQKKLFIQSHYMIILEHILGIVTDRNQVQFIGLTKLTIALCEAFNIPEYKYKESLDPENPHADNVEYVYKYVYNLFKTHFTMLTDAQLEVNIKGFFSYNLNPDKMREHIRDFLIQIKTACGEDTDDLFLEDKKREIEEAQAKKNAIPGIRNPNEIDDEMNEF